MEKKFLPLKKEDIIKLNWEQVDFVVVTGDAYIDHPSFGSAIISRLVESLGFKVAVLSQPDYHSANSFKEFGKPKYAFLIGGGNVDSMVAHYSVAKKRRKTDEYTPGGIMGKRPDRCVTVYSKLAKEAYPDVPVVIGGLEASLRRFAHYDYWNDEVMTSVLEQSGADLITFGMGERQTTEICTRLANGENIKDLKNVKGTCFYTNDLTEIESPYIECSSYSKISQDKRSYAKTSKLIMDNQDCVSAKILVQKQKNGYIVQNIPAKPLVRIELDKVYKLPFTREVHPSYIAMGGVPAIEEVQFSIIQNRGCFGGCNFCAITMHQGIRVTSRSKNSILEEAVQITKQPNFKGYIHDVGGPTANFRKPSCAKQLSEGACTHRKCLSPKVCENLIIDHSEYLDILRDMRKLPGIKKVFIRSGIRYDYAIDDKDDTFLKELIKYHVSGQLKVAPEHCAIETLNFMGKPSIEKYNKFSKKFYQITSQLNKKQYLVPYLMSSHPGSTLKDAISLAVYLHDNKIKPEQVQDFYPTPGTISTCMFYTGLDPATLKPIYVAKTSEEKAMQRALLQYYDSRNRDKVIKALTVANRKDLIPKLVPNYVIKKQNEGTALWTKPTVVSQNTEKRKKKIVTKLRKNNAKQKKK